MLLLLPSIELLSLTLLLSMAVLLSLSSLMTKLLWLSSSMALWLYMT